ncbi:5'-methylthioadenosine/adenosylhomocysteine nucleosidase [Polaromonas sp.]|uniref:5'-methylthioadenosine/adenosylhomocysteine nucleosidase n=1 Tax=Polaromonas sp. TaxID=1869339 RepID=UPI003CA76928
MTITAILSALAEEQQGLLEQLQQPRKTRHAGRDFWQGQLYGQPVVLALSRIGKVAAATTSTALIERFNVGRIVFTGVAGGLGGGVQVGDVVVATEFVQHDLDASPIFPRYEVPLYGQACFPCDKTLTALLLKASRAGLQSLALPATTLLHHGLMASGDRFVSGMQESRNLRTALKQGGHEALAVEMEGAAVAQVCFDYGLPFAAVRTISDRADDTAHVDFPVFVKDVASLYAQAIVRHLLEAL